MSDLTVFLDAFDALPWDQLPELLHTHRNSGSQEFYEMVQELYEFRHEAATAAKLQQLYDEES